LVEVNTAKETKEGKNKIEEDKIKGNERTE
jgi:hypothetical protein